MSASRRNFLQAAGTAAASSVVLGRIVQNHARSKAREIGDLTLIRDGKSSYAILVREDAPVAAQHGAQELQWHLKQMSGVVLPLITPADAAGRLPSGVAPDHFIVLSGQLPKEQEPPLGDDAYLVRTNGSRLEIYGGGLRGTLYGCYAFLEEILGVRWFTVDCTVIPPRKTVTVPDLNRQGAPAYEYRFPYWREASDRDWALRNRCNGLGDGCHAVSPNCLEYVVQRIDPNVGSAVHYGRGFFVHSFTKLVPPKTYPQLWNGGGLCTTNPAAVAAAVAVLRPAIAAQPEARLWSISQPDTDNGYCTCPECAQLAESEGAQSGPVIHFVNAIAAQLGALYPNVLFDTLAYGWSEAPPKHVRPSDNVCVRFAPINACVAHSLGTCEKNRDAYAHLVGWSKIAKHLYIWNYVTNFSHFLQPLPNVTSLCADVATYHQLGAVGLFSQGYFAPGGGGALGELKAYLVAKLTWDPTQDSKALIADYLHGVYGEGASYVQQWIDAIEAQVRSGNDHGQVHANSFDPITAPYISKDLIAQGATLFDRAEQATNGDTAALAQVRKAQLSVIYLQMLHSVVGSPDRTKYLLQLMQGAARYNIKNPRN